MDSQQTRDQQRILQRVSLNTWIYTLTMVLVILGLAHNLYELKEVSVQTDAAMQAAAANQGSIEADNRLMLAFIKRTADRWDKLSNDNPEIVVPKASDARPLTGPPLTDKELTRDPTPTTAPEPTRAAKESRRVPTRVRKPAPGFWERLKNLFAPGN